MCERRSSRTHKQVDYSKFDDIDDFADSIPPPCKKQRKVDCNTKGDKKIKKTQLSSSAQKLTSLTKRLPLEEKVYERNLQAALELSMRSSHDSQNEEVSHEPLLNSIPLTNKSVTVPEVSVSVISEAVTSVCQTALTPVSAVDSSEIKYLGMTTCGDNLRKPLRRAAAAKRKISVHESDEDVESFGEEEFDTESEGSNSDFDEDIVKKKSKRKTAKVNKQCRAASGGTSVKAKSSAPSSIQTSPQGPSPQYTAASPTESSPKYAPISRQSTVTFSSGKQVSSESRRPAWTPPGRSDGTSSKADIVLKSPTSGLRLGLSRHVRVKPLHPSLKIS